MSVQPSLYRRAAEACRNVQAQARPRDVEWFSWVPRFLDRMAEAEPEAEAVRQLDSITNEAPDAEHQGADEILLALVSPEVAAAYRRAATRGRGFWYS